MKIFVQTKMRQIPQKTEKSQPHRDLIHRPPRFQPSATLGANLGRPPEWGEFVIVIKSTTGGITQKGEPVQGAYPIA